MSIKTIYFDMDGVLADFDRGVKEILGFSQGWEEFMWDEMKKHPHFYYDLKPIEDAVELFKEVWKKYGDNCQILSAYPKPFRGIDEAYNDKILWIKKYLGEGIIANLVYREEKVNFIKDSQSVLVDDYDKNIDEWNMKGGTGILFTTASQVRNFIKEYE